MGCQPSTGQGYQTIMNGFAEKTQFNGTLLVAKGDTLLSLNTYGYENIEDSIHTSISTRYQLGSISKWITSLVVLKLVDEGTLSLTAPIGTYLPGYKGNAGKKTTLHHLITHTSGLPNDIIASYQADPSIMQVSISTSEAVRRYASGDLLFEPGSQFDYSHSNWILIKEIIEQTTGKTFESNVHELITLPFNLKDTGVFSGDASLIPHLAYGYEEVAPIPERALVTFPDYLVCAGGVYSTAPDLLSLLNALYGGNLLSEDLLARLDKVHVEEENYAYGGRVQTMNLESNQETVIWHTGSNGPSKSRISRVLANGLTVITLTNTGTSPEDTGELSEAVIKSFYQ
ncbi:MAG: serine hydrolase domain-containing protein [Rhodothermales bacterium]